MKILPMLIFLLLSGCAASHVTKIHKSKYAPKDYKPVGVVKYLNQGADFIVERRRESAFKEMYKACNGSYSITKEGQNSEGGSLTAGLGSVWSTPTQYWHIHYKCEQSVTKR